MWTFVLTTVFLGTIPALALNLDYLDPEKLQTVTTVEIQRGAALQIIRQFSKNVAVTVNHQWFQDKKDFFSLRTNDDVLYINASTGVAAVWGFNYYLKKYCNSQVEWQTENVTIPHPLPPVHETVVANDRFRYYQDTCTVSYDFVWWNVRDWMKHIAWMALNGINLTLAPVAQEAIWERIYRSAGMTQNEIDKQFTGPAFLCWLRMGNLRGWGSPLPQSGHKLQLQIQHAVINTLLNLGIAPILPTFNGHVPKAFKRIFHSHLFYRVKPWRNFSIEYPSGLFVRPIDPIFNIIGTIFLGEMGRIPGCHIYASEPFNEIDLPILNTNLVAKTARNIFKTLLKFDSRAVWLVQNSPFISRSDDWPKSKVKAFLGAVPNGRVLILDMQAEISPRYNTYDMYFGQPFIWCMRHNFDEALGRDMVTISKDVNEAMSRVGSTMIGIGLTLEGINQNYAVYDLMLESAWRGLAAICSEVITTTEEYSNEETRVVTAVSSDEITTTTEVDTDDTTRVITTKSSDEDTTTTEVDHDDEARVITTKSSDEDTTTTEVDHDDEARVITTTSGDEDTTITEVDTGDETRVITTISGDEETTTTEVDTGDETRVITTTSGEVDTTTTEVDTGDETRVITTISGDKETTTTEVDIGDKTRVITTTSGDEETTTTEVDIGDETRVITTTSGDEDTTTIEVDTGDETRVITTTSGDEDTTTTEVDTSDETRVITTTSGDEDTTTTEVADDETRVVTTTSSDEDTTTTEVDTDDETHVVAAAQSADEVTTITEAESDDDTRNRYATT